MRLAPWAAAALLVAAACAPQETPEQRQARLQAASDLAKTAIEAQLARFARHAATGAFDSAVAVYAPNFVVMPPNTPAMSSRDSLIAALSAGGPFQITFDVRNVWSDGSSATEHGTYSFTVTPPRRAPVTMNGKYMARWERINGEWLMTHDIWNDDAPMPGN
jgi:ketosteroid isomerase-like protein